MPGTCAYPPARAVERQRLLVRQIHRPAIGGDDRCVERRSLRTTLELGLARPDQSMLGWEVSRAARLFAGEHPGMPVLTFGAGQLEHAQSERERIALSDLIESIAFVALFVLRETGAFP